MKKNIFFSLALFTVLAVVISSCTTLQETGYATAEDGYRGSGSVYREDPLYYNSARPVLVRDAYTGRLFYVYPTDGFSPYGSSLYNMPFDNRSYNNRNYNNRRTYGNGRTNRAAGRTNNAPVVTEEQKSQQRQRQEESRKLILGKQ